MSVYVTKDAGQYRRGLYRMDALTAARAVAQGWAEIVERVERPERVVEVR